MYIIRGNCRNSGNIYDRRNEEKGYFRDLGHLIFYYIRKLLLMQASMQIYEGVFNCIVTIDGCR